MVKIAVVYYSATGSVHALAEAVAAGARDEGAQVRLRRARELVAPEVVARNDAWRAHLEATQGVPVAEVADLVWADGFALGTPSRFGQPASQLKQLIDSASGAWQAGELADKPATGFTSAHERHGGHEATLLALYQSLCHWGSLIMPAGYVDHDSAHAAGGNPYGVSAVAGDGPPSAEVLAHARLQGRRLTAFARSLREHPAEVLAGVR